MGRLMGKDLQKALQKLYADLRWDTSRQMAFNRRQCGKPWPQTTKEAAKIYHGLEAMLIRMMVPYWPAFWRLVEILCDIAYQLSPWEQKFLWDMRRKSKEGRFVSPRMIKKVREIAHKRGVECGFPPFRDIVKLLEQEREVNTR